MKLHHSPDPDILTDLLYSEHDGRPMAFVARVQRELQLDSCHERGAGVEGVIGQRSAFVGLPEGRAR